MGGDEGREDDAEGRKDRSSEGRWKVEGSEKLGRGPGEEKESVLWLQGLKEEGWKMERTL